MGGAAATFTVYAVTGAIYRRPMPAQLPAVHADLRSEVGAGKVHRAQTRQRRSGNKDLSHHPLPSLLCPPSPLPPRFVAEARWSIYRLHQRMLGCAE